MKQCLLAIALIVFLFAGTGQAYSQNWLVGGNMGLSLFDGTAGFHITPMAEILFNRNMGVGSEFSINTQAGTPLLWYSYFKYYFAVPGSKLKPYANAGTVLTLNIPNAPYFGILFGGGVNIPIANKLFVSPDLQLGPVFGVGGGTYNYFGFSTTVQGKTVFAVLIRGGIRYEI